MRIFGGLFLIVGMAAIGYFFFVFDTTIPSGGDAGADNPLFSGRSHNLGLLNDRIAGLIVGAAFMISGSVLALAPETRRDTVVG